MPQQQPHAPNEKFTDGIKPEWEPRVPPGSIRRLSVNDALGLVNEELIDEVGSSLLWRCRRILVANEAHVGRAACPRCEAIPAPVIERADERACTAAEMAATTSRPAQGITYTVAGDALTTAVQGPAGEMQVVYTRAAG